MLFKKIKQNKHVKPLYYYLTIFLTPFFCFWALEYYTHDPWMMAVLPQLINYLILLFFSLGFTLLTDSLLPGSLLILCYSLFAGILNYFVLDFRGNPVLPWDIYSIETALSVSDNYTYNMTERFYISTSILMGLMILVLVTSLIYRKWKKKGASSKAKPAHVKSPWRRRFAKAVLAWIIAFGISISMMNTAITSEVLTFTNLFTQWASYRDNGFTVSFIQNLQYMKISKPKGYNKVALSQEVETFVSAHESISQSTDTQSSIFVIMDEAFSDLSVLHEFDTNQDYMPFIHSLQRSQSQRVRTGQLFVSVCGGNTANTEFEFLTGNTLAYLPVGSVAYQQYVHGDLPSLAAQTASKGYSTYGIHPYGATGWNRNNVYPWLGFQTTQFKENFTDAQILRKYIDDRSALNKLISNFEENKLSTNAPLFAFEVTMQNHGGYTEEFADCPNEVNLLNSTHPYAKYTSQYLTLVQKTDQALKEFLAWVDVQKEPIMVVFFGDHQPNDYVVEPIINMTGKKKEEMDLQELQRRYVVPYVIYANYNLDGATNNVYPSAQDMLLTEGTTSVNYLGTEIAKLAGFELTPYQQFLQALKQELPVITANVVIDKDGEYMTMNEAKKKYGDALTLYEKLQYYYLFDGGNQDPLFK